jgi:hypothetical protein
MIWFIVRFYRWLGTTSNYSAIANLHNSQITTAPDNPFSSLLRLHLASQAQVLSSQPPVQNWLN